MKASAGICNTDNCRGSFINDVTQIGAKSDPTPTLTLAFFHFSLDQEIYGLSPTKGAKILGKILLLV